MTRVNLDEVQQHIEPFNGCPECKTREMLAELRAAREVLRRTYERLSQDGYDYDGPTLARIREFLTGRLDEEVAS